MAKFAESKLFQDEVAINRLARTNRSMLQTVKDWISDMVVKLTGTEEEKFFRNAERMYEKALREVGDTANNNGWQARYSISSHLMDELMSVLDGTFNSRKNEVYIGESSNFLTDTIKADALSETMPPNKAYSAMVTKEQAIHDGRYREGVNYHGLGPEGLLRALVASEDPIAAFADTSNGADKRVNNIILVTDEKIDGQYIIVTQALEVPARLEGKRLTANKVITAFDRSAIADDLVRAEAEHRLLHLDEKRSQTLLAGGSAYDSLRDIREADFERNIQLFWDRVKWAKSGMHEYVAESKLPATTDTDKKMLKAFVEKAQRVEDSQKTYYADVIREIIRSASQKDTRYADELRKFLKGLNWFDKP